MTWSLKKMIKLTITMLSAVVIVLAFRAGVEALFGETVTIWVMLTVLACLIATFGLVNSHSMCSGMDVSMWLQT